VSTNVVVAFGGVAALGLVGFLVAWFSLGARRKARLSSASYDEFAEDLLLTFKEFEDISSRLSLSKEQIRRMLAHLKRSSASTLTSAKK